MFFDPFLLLLALLSKGKRPSAARISVILGSYWTGRYWNLFCEPD